MESTTIKCECGKEIERIQSGMSNWIMRSGKYICGICQGLKSDWPESIISYDEKGRPGMIIKTKELNQ